MFVICHTALLIIIEVSLGPTDGNVVCIGVHVVYIGVNVVYIGVNVVYIAFGVNVSTGCGVSMLFFHKSVPHENVTSK